MGLYDANGTPIPQPLDILYAIYKPAAYYYEAVQMLFKLALWSALVFFDSGSEMQLATALITNILLLCVHLTLLPMGGAAAALLNIMQTAILVLIVYITFGAFSMDYLVALQSLAKFTDPQSVDEYDAHIRAIGIVMEILTIGL